VFFSLDRKILAKFGTTIFTAKKLPTAISSWCIDTTFSSRVLILWPVRNGSIKQVLQVQRYAGISDP
ncbi:hypothetical protein K0M31_012727, partial [Melipona bicolor]